VHLIKYIDNRRDALKDQTGKFVTRTELLTTVVAADGGGRVII
jgi:hypothetical protein